MTVVANYATKQQAELDQVLTQGLLTGALNANPKQVEWSKGSKTFTISHLKTSGFQNHNRGKGWNEGTVENERTPYTVEQDRDVEFFVDEADVDETNKDLEAAKVTRTFLLEQAIPEVDAYRFSKLATIAKEVENTSTGVLTDPVKKLKAAILPLRRHGANNLVVYVSSAMMNALELDPIFGRSLSVQQSGAGVYETRVGKLDGVEIIEVWDSGRFFDEYDFTDGFVETQTAKAIDFLVVNKTAVFAITKIQSIYFHAPGQHTEGDGYLYQNRMYHDIFVLEQQKDTSVAVGYSA